MTRSAWRCGARIIPTRRSSASSAAASAGISDLLPGRLDMMMHLLCGLAFVALLSSCGQLSGDIYLKTVGGDAKRAPGAPITLVRPTNGFMDAWKKAEREYQDEMQAAIEAYQSSEGEYENVRRAVNILTDRPAWDAAAARSLAALKDVQGIHSRYEKWAIRVIQWAAVATTEADVNGHYELSWVRPGPYIVFAAAPIGFRLAWWSVPVAISPWKNRLDLSDKNLGWSFELPSLL